MTRPGLEELVEHLRRATRDGTDPHLTAKRVATVLETRTPSIDLLTAEEREGRPDAYSRLTLHCERDFSVAAVVWRPGQITEIHDHLVWCSFMILQGEETETLYGFDGDRVVEVGVVQRPTGSVSGVAPPDDIHRVQNLGDSVAITLHVYGADLSRGSSVRRVYKLGESQ
jgi:predicted metal-dependent enzyme (double-stranded beta helix superfamily)